MSEIWTMASGKGGNGKSILSSLLAINLANSGRRVLLVDADFTGPNIHNLFKLKKVPDKNLSGFFSDKINVRDLIYKSNFPNLHIITGNRSVFKSDRIYYQQKLKFLRNITRIAKDYSILVLDLGAGASMDTVDTFLIGDRKILVSSPEVTSIENLYFFLKKTIFRKLKIVLTNSEYKHILKSSWDKSDMHTPLSYKKFIDFLSSHSEEVADLIMEEIDRINCYLILNMVKTQKEAELGASIKSVIQKQFNVATFYVGYIEFLDQIRNFINDQDRFYNITKTTLGIELNKIVSNITAGKNITFHQMSHG